jgi:hypothetical protein
MIYGISPNILPPDPNSLLLLAALLQIHHPFVVILGRKHIFKE